MNKLAKDMGMLGGIVAFCAGLLVGLLRDCPPILAVKKAALCGLILGVVAWMGVQVALGVMGVGVVKDQEDEGA